MIFVFFLISVFLNKLLWKIINQDYKAFSQVSKGHFFLYLDVFGFYAYICLRRRGLSMFRKEDRKR